MITNAKALLLPLALFLGCSMTDPPKLLTWPDLTSRPRPAPDASISYGKLPLQVVDIWLPRGKGPHRTVIMVHGGCWQSSIADRSLMNWIAADLRDAGYAVWNIEYRGVDEGPGHPDMFDDVGAAVDIIRNHATQFSLDTSKVVAIGHSAGGHLALWAAARHRLPRSSPMWRAKPLPIHHVISLGGLPDLEAVKASPDNGCGTEIADRIVGVPSPSRPDVYADTSVPRLLPLGVGQSLVNGREDRIIPMRMADDYVARALATGDKVTLDVPPSTGHVELIAPETAAWAKAKALIAEAFAQ